MKQPLTAEQEAYFSRSVARDDRGALLVLYHGVGKGPLFNTLSYKKIGTARGPGYGPFIYTTPDRNSCQLLYGDKKADHVISVYVDARNPLEINRVGTIDRKQCLQILKRNDPEHKIRKLLARDLAEEECRIARCCGLGQEKSLIESGKMTPAGFKRGRRAMRHGVRVTFFHYWNAYRLIFRRIGEKSDDENLVYLYQKLKQAYPDLDVERYNRSVMAVTGYDSIIKYASGAELDQIAVFTAEQIKSTNNLTPERNNSLFGSYPMLSVKELEPQDPV